MTPNQHTIDQPVKNPPPETDAWHAIRSRTKGVYYAAGAMGVTTFWSREDAERQAAILRGTSPAMGWTVEPLPARPPAVMQADFHTHERTVAIGMLHVLGVNAVVIEIREAGEADKLRLGLPTHLDDSILIRSTADHVAEYFAGIGSPLQLRRELSIGLIGGVDYGEID